MGNVIKHGIKRKICIGLTIAVTELGVTAVVVGAEGVHVVPPEVIRGGGEVELEGCHGINIEEMGDGANIGSLHGVLVGSGFSFQSSIFVVRL